MSMITAASWVPRGYAAQFPNRFELNEQEFDRISKLAQRKLEAAHEDLDDARRQENGTNEKSTTSLNKTNEEIDEDLREYDLEHYDDDDDDDEYEDIEDEDMEGGGAAGGGAGGSGGIFGNIKNLIYHDSNEEDPYITLKDDAESDSEREELQILPEDNLILATRVEDDIAHLEFYVYEDEEDNLYVHHDVMLPAIPLSLEWINFPSGKHDPKTPSNTGNLVAVGTMDPEIELWDLDTVDSMYPHAILGYAAGDDGAATSADSKKKKKKKSRSKAAREDRHTDAVLALASNPLHRNLLASASADKTIKLWDLTTASAAGTSSTKSYSYHTDKVCALAWHPSEASALLSGSYDRSAVAADMRAGDASSSSRRWTLDADVETLRWDPHAPERFLVATEAGALHLFDARVTPSVTAAGAATAPKALWTLQAHDAPLSAFDVNAHVPGFLATGSADKTVKLWRTPEAAGGNGAAGGPTLVATRNPDAGRVFSAAFAPDADVAFRLAVAGSTGTLQIWDTSTNAGVRRAFASAGVGGPDDETDEAAERVVGLTMSDDEGSSDEEEEGNGADGGGVDL